MVIGDGNNHTVITGNHSVVDGRNTFNSATFIVTEYRRRYESKGVVVGGTIRFRGVMRRNLKGFLNLKFFYSHEWKRSSSHLLNRSSLSLLQDSLHRLQSMR
ncbi:hypothetical protein L1887_32583 [Cichorium endivia]|nr:hypothetical protein L1887_32583 [Cichorium endivia]